MDFDFSRLSWRSFEQMVQSLAIGHFGTRLVPFGDGPDGGREAVIDAPFTFADESVIAGKLVLQVKFRQRPDAKTDGAWAVKELKRELGKFKKAKGGRQCPEYFVFVTNVAPSSTLDGGKDQMEATLGQAQAWGLRGWQVWDYDKLRALLELNEAVRTTYLGWITPGDVLARLLAVLDEAEPAFGSTLLTYLEKELIGDQFANLEQAGHNSEDAIPLSQVFVDLPSSSNQTSVDDEGHDFLARALDLAGLKLDQASVDAADGQHAEVAFAPTQRLVLVGGPGQGKSTLGQYLCQMLRAALLRERPRAELSIEGRAALQQVSDGCELAQLKLSSGHRYPLRIVLSDFAEALAGDAPPKSLIAYLAGKISDKVSTSVSTVLLQRWLARYPWLLVLDGLDEVPASSNRDDVLQAVTEFWVDIAAASCDVLVIATTRPQGYNDDFSPQHYRHEYLMPLSPERAFAYAERLVPVRYRGDVERQDKVRARLRRAVSGPTTRRLMTTPLQVTIMTALVDRTGQPPQERWTLFNEYYNVVYLREMERSIPAVAVLRDFRPDVDAIHRRVALYLQMTGELRSHSEARLSHAELRAIVLQRLHDEGHEGEGAEDIANQLVEAAELRLVFLVGAESDQIGFEIRSLQEFMAAEALVDGPEDALIARLRAIGPCPSWRNVFLFAAGNCFARRQHLREALGGLCGSLNDDPDDPLARGTLAGSELALELLEDGSVQHQPRAARMFARLAFRLLGVADQTLHVRLAAEHSEATDIVYREELGTAVAGGTTRLAALRCLTHLDRMDVAWASAALREAWPDDAPACEGLAAMSPFGTWTDRMLPSILDTIGNLEPASVRHVNPGWSDVDLGESWRWLQALAEEADGGSGVEEFILNGSREFQLTLPWLVLLSTRPTPPGPRLAGDGHDGILAVSARFALEPSAALLGDILERFAASPDAVWRSAADYVAWPIGVCLAAAADHGDLARWAVEARAGRLGSRDDWVIAQERWNFHGVTLTDLRASNSAALPVDPSIADEGFPMACSGWLVSDPGRATRMLRDVFSQLDPGPIRMALARSLAQLSGLLTKPWPHGRISLVDLIDAMDDGRPRAPFPMRAAGLANIPRPEDDAAAGEAIDRLLGMTRLLQVNEEHARLGPAFREDLHELSRGGHSSAAVRVLAMEAGRDDVSPRAATSLAAPRDRAAGAVLEAIHGNAADAGTTFGATWDGMDNVMPTLSRLAVGEPARWAVFLVAALAAMPADAWELRRRLTAVLRDLSSRRRSPLADPERWAELELFKRPVASV